MMKKILMVLMLLLSVTAFACDEIKCPSPYDLTSETSRFLSRVTGQNFVAEHVGERLLKKFVKKNITSGKIKTDLKSYSTRDLRAGRFKSIEVTGKDVVSKGVYISSFTAKTLCDFNYLADDKDGNLLVKEDMPMSVSIEITEQDLNNTMKSSGYKRVVKDINNLMGDFCNVEDTYVKLKNGKIYFALKYAFPFIRKTKEIELISSVGIENGKIALQNTELLDGNPALSKLSGLLNYINPLDFSAKILENKEAEFNVQNVKISDGKVKIDGIVTLLKDKD